MQFLPKGKNGRFSSSATAGDKGVACVGRYRASPKSPTFTAMSLPFVNDRKTLSGFKKENKNKNNYIKLFNYYFLQI